MKELSNPKTDDQLPIELECFLLTWGFQPSDRPVGYIKHQPVTKPQVRNKTVQANPIWVPSHPNEEPPF